MIAVLLIILGLKAVIVGSHFGHSGYLGIKGHTKLQHSFQPDLVKVALPGGCYPSCSGAFSCSASSLGGLKGKVGLVGTPKY